MSITAKIVADSITKYGVRITTFELRYPRMIHSEFMTHRMFSRNAASSRAIPVLKMLRDIRADMAHPIHWGSNQSGMQAKEELKGFKRFATIFLWELAGTAACSFAWMLYKLGAHKQIVNRIVEPFSHITVAVTSVSWANFYHLRNHPDAQPEIQELARQMYNAQQASTPVRLDDGQWHLPYVTEYEKNTLPVEKQIRISVARVASTSYKTVDGKEMTTERADHLYDRLVGSDPLHASPTEHQAKSDTKRGSSWRNPKLHGNLPGMIQYRKTLKNEYIAD